MTTPSSSTDDLDSLPPAELARFVRELRITNERLQIASWQSGSAALDLLDERLRRSSLLTQLVIEFRDTLAPDQIVEHTLRVLAMHTVSSASVIIVGPGDVIDLALAVFEGEVQPITPDHARSVIAQGLAGWVVRHGGSVALSDVARDRRWLQFSEQHGDGSVIVIPINQSRATLGALTVHRPIANAFNSYDLIILEGVAAQLGVALSAARHYASERLRRDQAMTLLSMSQFLSAERSLADLASMLNEKSTAVFGVRQGLLFLSDSADAVLQPVLPNPTEEWSQRAEIAGGAARLAWAGQRIVTTIPSPDLTCLAFPLTHHGVTIGSFVLVHASTSTFSTSLWSLLTIFTDIVAAACANVRLVGRLTGQTAALEQLVEQRTYQMQHSRDALRAVFDSLPDGVLLLDTQECLLAANQSFCHQIISCHPRELVGQSYAHLWQLLERQSTIHVELMPVQDPGHQELVVRISGPADERAFIVRRTPVGTDGQPVDQYLEFWIAKSPSGG